MIRGAPDGRAGRMNRLLLVSLCCFLTGNGPLYAKETKEREQPPWLRAQVVNASMDIKMTVTQQGIFREAVGSFLDGLTGEYVSMAKQQKDDIPRRMKQARSRHARKMDKKMRTALDDQQYARYLVYRALLLTSTDTMVDPQTRGGTRARFAANCKKEAFRIWRPTAWCPVADAS